MPGSLISVNQALIGQFVDLRYRFTISGGCNFSIALFHGIDDFFNGRAHAGFQREVVLAPALSLFRTFSCGFDIGHSKDPYGLFPC